MSVHNITVRASQQGLYNITADIAQLLRQQKMEQGLCTICIQHTSASLTIQENADPSARHDLERWLQRLVPENDPLYTHTMEGPDDMPSHIKSMLTTTTMSIPVWKGRLALGTWQGIYLWEHRHHPSDRTLVIHLGH